MVLAIAGDEPVIARKPNYLFDPAFTGQFDPNRFYAKAEPVELAERESQSVIRRYSRPRRPTASEVLDDNFDFSNNPFRLLPGFKQPDWGGGE